MSKKKSRAWFVSPQWAELISKYYADDAEAGHALKADPKVLAKLRSRSPVAKSTLLKMLHRFAAKHGLYAKSEELVVDTRRR
jgi:hypothetical protein